MEIRRALESEYGPIGDMTVRAYAAIEGYELPDEYAVVLRDVASRVEGSEVLVATDRERLLGSVTFIPGAHAPGAEFDDADAAGMRMLAVDPDAQGRGVGKVLASACLDRARLAGKRRLVLHTTPWMSVAQTMYERLGFHRDEERDVRRDGLHLMAYSFLIPGA